MNGAKSYVNVRPARRYIAWVGYDWGEGADPEGKACRPIWDQISARELYAHAGDPGTGESGERLEWDNLVHEPQYARHLPKEPHCAGT